MFTFYDLILYFISLLYFHFIFNSIFLILFSSHLTCGSALQLQQKQQDHHQHHQPQPPRTPKNAPISSQAHGSGLRGGNAAPTTPTVQLQSQVLLSD